MAGAAVAQDWPMGDVMALGVWCAAFPELKATAKERKEARKRLKAERRAREAQKPKPANLAWPRIIIDDKRTPGWMKEGDARPGAELGGRHRRKGRAALTEIGEKGDVEKFPVLPRKYGWQIR